MTDLEAGKKGLEYFRIASLPYPKFKSMSYNDLLSLVGGKNPDIFLDGFGFTINSLEMSQGQVQEAMQYLAQAAQGGIPKQTLFFQALSTRLTNITTSDYILGLPSIAKDTAVDVVKGAQQVGDAVLDTGKTLLMVGPLLVVLAVIFIGYGKTRTLAGR